MRDISDFELVQIKGSKFIQIGNVFEIHHNFEIIFRPLSIFQCNF